MLEQPEGGPSGALAPEPGESRSGHLNHASLFGPFDHALRIVAQNRIALRMGENHGDSTIPELKKRFVDLLRNAVIAELNQQIARTLDDIARRMGERILHIVKREMKVAAHKNFGSVSDELLQMSDQLLHILAIIVIAVVSMGAGHHVGNAISGGRAAHGHAIVP